LPSLGKRVRRTAIAAGTALLLGAGLFAGLGPAPGSASSHREAPLVSATPQLDGTDLYAFTSPDKPNSVTILSNWLPFEEPAGGPNFYSFATNVYYDINIDNNGDAIPDIVYRWIFKDHYRDPTGEFLYNDGPVTSLGDSNLLFYQTYDLQVITTQGTTTLIHAAKVGPSFVGVESMPNYLHLMQQAAVQGGGVTSFTGQTDDPFFLDLRVFDLLYGGNFGRVGDDTLAGFNVQSFGIQVPKTALAVNGDPEKNPVIGIWTTAETQSVRTTGAAGSQSLSGPFVQVSRLGMPLVNEVVVPYGLKDQFNASEPVSDHTNAALVAKVEDPILPHLVNAIYGLPVPDCPDKQGQDRECDLFPVFLTGLPGLNDFASNQDHGTIVPAEMLRMNMTTPRCSDKCSNLGVIGGDVQGFPNGRRLADDIIDVSLRVAEGILISGHDPRVDKLGDGVDQNDRAFQRHFPYEGLPWSGSNANVHDPDSKDRFAY
jgi:hypothetical protein